MYPLSRLKSLVVIVLLSLAPALSVSGQQPRAVLTLSRAVAFDQLAERLEVGELSPDTDAGMVKVLGRLDSLVPAGDARRALRYRYTYCIFGMDAQPKQGVAYAEQGIADARRMDYPAAEANFHFCRGEHLESLTTPRDALSDYSAGIEIARHAEDMRLVADGLSWRGNVQSLLGEPALALVDFLRAQENYQESGAAVEGELNLLDIAVAYRRIGEINMARKYTMQSLAYAKKRHNVLQQVSVEAQLGFLDSDSSDQASARRHFEASLQLARGIGDHEGLASAYLGQAEAFNLQGHHAEALARLNLARSEFDKAADQSSQGMITLQTAEAKAGLGQHAEAIADYDRAEQLLGSGGNLRYLSELLDARARSYEALGRPGQAVLDLRRTIQVRAALQRNAQRYNTTLMSYQFDSARRDQQDQRIKEESALQGRQLAALKRARNWQNLAMLFGGLLLMGLIWQAVRQLRRGRRLHSLAMTDALTGIANRRQIERRMVNVLASSVRDREHAVLVAFDIDDFKRINDAYGHQVGDTVLVRLVEACSETLRALDQMGRVGGEEFLVILPQTDLEAGRLVAERLRERVNAIDLDDIAVGLKVSISLGVAQLDDPAENLPSLIGRADQALYRAKAAGRNRVEIAGAYVPEG
jgi:diguanylate cyclase (GGDEF)-like protein